MRPARRALRAPGRERHRRRSGRPAAFPGALGPRPRDQLPGQRRRTARRLAVAGFWVVAWEDKTAVVAEWTRENLAKRAARKAAGEEGRALGTHLLLGPEFPRMADNLARNLAERRVEVVSVVAERM